jgi:hypothetical protein
MLPEDVQTAWAAGLLEGEGCFGVQHSRTTPRIQINMTDRDIVQRFADWVNRRWPASGHEKPLRVRQYAPAVDGRKDVYNTSLIGRRAALIMAVVRPLMGERRGEKINTILREAYGG